MPFGLCNTPSAFQRLMDGIFPDQNGKESAAYRDDLLIYALLHPERIPIHDRRFAQLIDSSTGNQKVPRAP